MAMVAVAATELEAKGSPEDNTITKYTTRRVCSPRIAPLAAASPTSPLAPGLASSVPTTEPIMVAASLIHELGSSFSVFILK